MTLIYVGWPEKTLQDGNCLYGEALVLKLIFGEDHHFLLLSIIGNTILHDGDYNSFIFLINNKKQLPNTPNIFKHTRRIRHVLWIYTNPTLDSDYKFNSLVITQW